MKKEWQVTRNRFKKCYNLFSLSSGAVGSKDELVLTDASLTECNAYIQLSENKNVTIKIK